MKTMPINAHINTDIYGQALLDYLDNQVKSPLTTTSDISEEDEMPLEYLFRDEAQMPEIERIALSFAKGTTLDVGAGAGSHSLALQSKGISVRALDISPLAIQVCRRRGVVDTLCEDIMVHKGSYDTILLLMNGLGIGGTLDKLRPFLEKLYSLLYIGGSVIADSTDIKYMFEEEDGSMWVDMNKDYYGQVRFHMHYGGDSSAEFNWLYVDFVTLESMAAELGFEVKRLYTGSNDEYLVSLTRL